MSDIKPKSTAVTEARRAAARTNGAKSKGPVTPEGKARSAGNAVTHGLTATDHLFLTESKEDYEALLAAYRAEYDPQGQTENDLVEHLTKSRWFQDRTYAMIAALIDVTIDRMRDEIDDEFKTIDHAVRTVLAFEKKASESNTLALLHRYAARHTRDYHRALDKIKQIQSDRRPQPPPPTPEPPCECKLQKEPKPTTTPAFPATSNAPLVVRPSSLTTQVPLQPLAPGLS